MLADRLEEGSRRGDGVLFRAVAERLGGQPGQVAFQQRPVDPGQGVDVRGGLGQERAEPGQARDVGLRGGGGLARTQPQPGPALGQCP